MAVAAGCIAVAVFTLAAGCATVKVQKVPTPSQYIRWTDAMQHKADKMEGFRFYLPRPFLNVFESFPIRTDIYIADGMVSPDGKYVIIRRVRSDSGMAAYVAGLTAGTSIPAREIRGPSSDDVKEIFKQQSGIEALVLDEITKRISQTVLTGIEETGKKAATSSAQALPKRTPTTNTGKSTRDVTVDNGAFAYQPMRGNFDLAYLPDFEEQYVVSSAAHLGNAQFALNLGQGWSLQGFNSLVDNSEINKRIFDVIDTSIDLAKAAASAALGIPLPSTAAEAAKLFGAQAGKEDDKEGIPGTPVSLKIVVVHYAAKGLYPVIKPRELQERTIDPGDSFGILDLFKLFPKVQMSSNMDPTAIFRSQQAIENQSGSFTVPRYPYQYVSFNTFRFMAIEVIKTDNKPFDTKYHPTGTEGPTDEQRVDLASEIKAGISRKVKKTKPGTSELGTNLTGSMAILTFGSGDETEIVNVELTSVDLEGTVLTVALGVPKTTPKKARDKDAVTVALLPAVRKAAVDHATFTAQQAKEQIGTVKIDGFKYDDWLPSLKQVLEGETAALNFGTADVPQDVDTALSHVVLGSGHTFTVTLSAPTPAQTVVRTQETVRSALLVAARTILKAELSLTDAQTAEQIKDVIIRDFNTAQWGG